MDPLKEKFNFGRKEKKYIMELKKIEILLDEALKAIKTVENILEKLENRMVYIKIQQNTIISIGKDPKYIKEIIGKIV